MLLEKRTAVCLDIGGTFIKYGLLTEDGELSNFKKQKTNKNGTDGLIGQVIEIVKELIIQSDENQITGIGISSAGQVNHKKGNILFATDNLPGWTGIDIKSIIENHFKLRCCIDNDVNCAALGEMYFGNAKGLEDFVCITIGTGIGGAIVKDSKLIHGYVGSAGEVGHMIIKAGGRRCNCGNRGCYEQYASASALKRDIIEKLGMSYLTPDNGFKLLITDYQTDQKLRNIMNGYIKYVSMGIINLLHLFNPAAVIIGGFVSEYDFLLKKISENVYQKAMPEFTRDLMIFPTLLDNKAALFGVSTYIFKEIQ
ncbi:MAG TPA: ROK family protein [Firmicutes bacterium]|nr:ROK family protein [Bacillota bacterium]